MGFFLAETPEAASGSRAPARRKRPSEPVQNGDRGCDSCPLQRAWPTLLSSRMPMLASPEADILVLGEGPRQEEDVAGVPFAAGDVRKLFQRCFSPRDSDRIAWQNSVRCKPPSGIPARQEVWACSQHLEADIERLRPKAILGLGSVPLQSFYPGAAIHRIHGMKFPVQIGSHVCWYYPVIHPDQVLRLGGENSSMYPVLRADIKRFFQDVDSWPKPKIHVFNPKNVMFPSNYEEATEILEAMQDPVAIDFETKQLRPYMPGAQLLTCGASDGEITMAWPIDHPSRPTNWGLQIVKDIVARHLWICHSGAMELSWIWYQMGLDWDPTPFEDTMTFGRVQHDRETQTSLGAMTRLHLGVDVKKLTDVDAKRIMEYPIDDVLTYNGVDAEATAVLRKYFIGQRDHTKMPPTTKYRRNVERAIAATVSTVWMELKGLPTSPDITRSLYDKFHGLKLAAEKEIRTLYEVREYERTYQTEFNLGNSEHVGTALVQFGKCQLPQTANSKKKSEEGTSTKVRFSTDDSILGPLADSNPLAKTILLYRGYDKLESTYLLPYHPELDGSTIMPDGLIHPGYTVLHTATMRLSSEDPNIQNFPKRKNREIRSQIAAPPGHIILAFDYAQLEARILAMASMDIQFITELIEGVDTHAFWRDQILDIFPEWLERVAHKTGLPAPKATMAEDATKKLMKAARDWGKNDFVFASFYGSTTKSCAERLNMPQVLMQELHGQLWERYKGVKEWIKGQRAMYRDTGAVELITGVRRADIMNGNEPINTPIQGSAAHVVIEAQNAISARARLEKDPYLHPRINIHDDLTFIIPDTDSALDHYVSVISEELVKPRFDWNVVPLAVEANVGYNWADLHEIAVIKGDYIR